MRRMRFALAGLAFAALLAAKGPKNVFTVNLAAPIRADDVQVRYALLGKFGTALGWQTYPEDSEITIATEHRGTPATGLKGVFYAPGCEFERVSADDFRTAPRELDFKCRALPAAKIQGRFPRPAEWRQLQVQVEVRYRGLWINRYLGAPETTDMTLGVGSTRADANGGFELAIPLFAKDPANPDGEFLIVLREPNSGNVVGTLGPAINIAPQYPASMEFTLQRLR